MTQTTTRKPRRMAREPDAAANVPSTAPGPADCSTRSSSKLDRVEALLLAEGGTSIAEIMAETGWQQHSVRGAMAGALKKRGLVITSDKLDGTRRYRAKRS